MFNIISECSAEGRPFTGNSWSFSKLSVTSPKSQLILQPCRRFTYVTAHSTLPLLHLHHSSFSNSSFASPTSQALQLILQASSHFTYVTAHSDSPSFPSLHLRHSSFYNPSLALPTSLLILQPFRCFTYVTAHSPTLLSLLPRHRIFTYVTWRAAHVRINKNFTDQCGAANILLLRLLRGSANLLETCSSSYSK